MKFEHDWFSDRIKNFELCKEQLNTKNNFLEIGVFEGRATCWLLENVLTDDGQIICIDSFVGEKLFNVDCLEQKFYSNVFDVKKENQKIVTLPLKSIDALSVLNLQNQKFDYIYIDGSHNEYDVLTDACLSWPLLKQGGIMHFDDYELETEAPHISSQIGIPKLGIDGFLNCIKNQYEIVFKNYQIGIKKL